MKTRNELTEELIALLNNMSEKEMKETIHSISTQLKGVFGIITNVYYDYITDNECDNNDAIDLIANIILSMKSCASINEFVEYVFYVCDEINRSQQKYIIELFGVSKDSVVFIVDNVKQLTLSDAESLIGKTIIWGHPGYNPTDFFRITRIGSLIKEWDMIKDEMYDDDMTRGEYLEKTMPNYINKSKNTTCIIDVNGKDTYMRELSIGLYKEPTFTFSDADREVLYVTAESI